jgi:UPF0755 protein
MSDTLAPDEGAPTEPEGADGEWVEVGESWGRVYDDTSDEYVGVPRDSSAGRRVLWVLGGIALFLVLVVGSVVVWLNRQISPPGGEGDPVTLEVTEGATVSELAGDLEREGIITNALVFRFYADRNGLDSVQAGTYDALRENMAMGDVIDVLQLGPAAPPPAAQVTFPEGERLSELSPLILSNLGEFDEAELATAYEGLRSTYMPSDSTNLEGFLFPDTYRIEQGDEADERKLLEQMVQRFDEVGAELGLDESEARVGLSPYEVVIVASIIEREAKVPADQPKVAQVIYNRLAQGMNLEIDATLLYGIGHKETLTESDLATDTPYNTRLYGGLPPTPIAMPGRAALEAALNPEPGPWLYYVLADAEGNHFFTDNYDEFLRVADESREAGIFE